MAKEQPVSLKEHFEKILTEKDKAISIALAAAKEAVAVAEANAQKWRESANEWRGAMNDRETNFLQRSEFLAYKENTEKSLKAEKERTDKNEGKTAGTAQTIGYIVGAFTIGSIIMGFLVKYIFK